MRYMHVLYFLLSATVAQQLAAAESSPGEDDDGDLGTCFDDLSANYGDIDDWAFLNPSMMVSLALAFNRTGSCRLDSFLHALSDNQVPTSTTPEKPDGLDFSGDQNDMYRMQKRDDYLDTRPTPAPTGDPSSGTTVHITDEDDFALLLPVLHGGMHDASNPQLLALKSCRAHIGRGKRRHRVLYAWERRLNLYRRPYGTWPHYSCGCRACRRWLVGSGQSSPRAQILGGLRLGNSYLSLSLMSAL